MNDALRIAAAGSASGTTSKRGSKKDASVGPRVVYTPHPGVTPEAEARALASIYKRAIERSKQKQTAAEGVNEKRNFEPAGGQPKEGSG